VRAFGGHDVSFLKDFGARLTDAATTRTMPLFELNRELNERQIAEVTGSWANSIQLSQPAASILDPDSLLRECIARYLQEPRRGKRQFRDRRRAAAIARASIEAAVYERVGDDHRKYVRHQFYLPGQFADHKFDVALANGRVFSVVDGLSFEVPDRTDLLRDVDATAWAISDVKRRDPEVEAAVVVLAPRSEHSKAYQRARSTFRGVDAEVLTETEADRWADGLAERSVTKALHTV
jgi:hypothetical protein